MSNNNQLKLKKSVLKQLIKECLVEILNEGIASSAKSSSVPLKEVVLVADEDNERTNYKQRESNPSNHRVDHTYRHPSSVGPKKTIPVVDNIQDPLLKSIFADTLNTTLKKQHLAESSSGVPFADEAAAKVAQIDPIDIAGSEKWADIAFAPKITPR